MKKLLSILFIGLLWMTSFNVAAQKDRNVAEYNLNVFGTGFIDGNEAEAKGFDPVSTFLGQVEEGKEEYSLEYEGVNYLFASEENKTLFLQNPEKFEPTYGGYCARAMVDGNKVHIQTKLYSIVGNRAFYFVSKRAKRSFDREIAGNAAKADAHWKAISGEEPRL
jgi:YHS domain-containing protein